MKKIIRITRSILPVAILIVAYSCKEHKQAQNDTESDPQPLASEADQKAGSEASLEFKDNTAQQSYQHYIHIKTALINGDEDEVKRGAEMLLQYSEAQSFQTAVKDIAETSDIAVQREAFAEVSLQMEPMLKQNISSGNLYKQFCPMALNNKGAYWLSEVKEIRNPYFGNQMLKCGSVVETIN